MILGFSGVAAGILMLAQLRHTGRSERSRQRRAQVLRRPSDLAVQATSVHKDRSRIDLWRCQVAEVAESEADMVLCHFIVSNDVVRSVRFYTEVLGGELVFSKDNLRYVALANS